MRIDEERDELRQDSIKDRDKSEGDTSWQSRPAKSSAFLLIKCSMKQP